MRKRIILQDSRDISSADEASLDIKSLAQVEITSEDPVFPIESALISNSGSEWKAAQPGKQTIRILFDKPQNIKQIHLEFNENTQSRTHEFMLCWLKSGGQTYQELVRQQYTFSPSDTTCEIEDYHVDLHDLSVLELKIIPDISGGSARASLSKLKLT
jgi:hypothetical protein